MNRSLRGTGCGALLILAAGCYESATPLGPLERGALDRTLVGSWHCKDSAEGSASGETLFNVRQLELKARSGGPRWIFVRAKREPDGRLVLSVVKKDSLEKLTEQAALREIESRVKDEARYGSWAECTAKG